MGGGNSTQASGTSNEELSTLDVLDVSSKQLKTLQNIDLGLLRSLAILNISNNELNSLVGISRLSGTLKELDLSWNKLERLPEELFHLTLLNQLKASNCSLTDDLPPLIGNLKNLTKLDLSNNKLKRLPTQIDALTKLDVLNVSFNKLEQIPKELGSCISLTKLILNQNELKQLPAEIGKLQHLVLLNLADNFLEDIPKEISGLQSLSKLYIDHNQLLDLRPEIAQLSNLKELNIRANQLTELPSEFAKLQNLQVIDLAENEFKDPVYNNDDIPKLLEYLKTKPATKSNNNNLLSVRGSAAPNSAPVGRARKQRVRVSVDERNNEQIDLLVRQAKENQKIEKAPKRRLYQIKGKNRIFVRQVEPVCTSLNHGDSFVLDGGGRIFVWFGLESYYRERNKASFVADQFNIEQGQQADIIYIDDGKQYDNTFDAIIDEFYTSLKGKGYIASAKEGADDLREENNMKMAIKLFRFSEASGRLDVMAWVGQALSKEMLDSSACFVLDCHSMIFVWSGIYSSMSERAWAMLKAEELISHGNRPSCTNIIWVVDGDELFLFRDMFDDWQDMSWDVEDKQANKKESKKEKKNLEQKQKLERRESKLSKKLDALIEDMEEDQSIQAQQLLTREEQEQTRKILQSLHHSGYLDKFMGKNDWKQFFFVLDNSHVYQYNTDSEYLLGAKATMKISLSSCTFGDYADKTNQSTSCFIIDKQDKKEKRKSDSSKKALFPVILRAKSDTQMHEWLTLMLKHQILADEPTMAKDVAFTSTIGKKDSSKQLTTESPSTPKSTPQETPTIVDTSNLSKAEQKKVWKDKIKSTVASTQKKTVQTAAEIEAEIQRELEQEENQKAATPSKPVIITTPPLSAEEEEKRRKAIEKQRQVEEKAEKARQERELKKSEERKSTLSSSTTAPEVKPAPTPAKATAQPASAPTATSGVDTSSQSKSAKDLLNARLQEQIKKTVPPAQPVEAAKPVEEPEEEEEEKGSTKLTTPSKTAAAQSGRRAPRSNPIRDRQQRAKEEDAKRAEREKEQAQAQANQAQSGTPAPASQSTNVSGRSAALGGFGLLYTLGLGADDAVFKKPSSSSGSKRVEEMDNTKPRLIQIKGRRNIFVRMVELSHKSLNRGDVFLLDTAKKGVIYQWNGADANRIVKGKGMDVAKSIKDKERSGNSRVVILEDGKTDAENEFWEFLGGKHPIPPSDVDDVTAEKAVWSRVKLYKAQESQDPNAAGTPLGIVTNVTAETFGLELVEIGSARLFKAMLVETECYILDTVTEMFVWTGKKAPLKMKNTVLKLGKNILEQRDFWTAPLQRELPGAESILFKEKFADWGGNIPIQMQQVPVGLNTAAAQEQQKIDVLKLHDISKRPHKEDVIIDDGTGKLEIWRVEDNHKVDVSKSLYGQFFSGESYVILYTYVFKNKDCFLIYFWQGRNSSILEKGTSALLTIELDDKLKGMAKEIRVVQNKEPKHFFSIFKKNPFIVYLGKERDNKPYSLLFEVHSANEWDMRAIQVLLKANSLRSCSTFVLHYNQNSIQEGIVYIWRGKTSTDQEFNFAKQMMQNEKNIKIMNEGEETAEFWKAIGGKESYVLCKQPKRRTPRMFNCSIGSGVFVVEEVFPFSQDDLLSEDVFLLDAVDTVFIWIGKLSNEREKKMAMETAVEYVQAAPDGRAMTISDVYVVLQNQEPLEFTCHFHGWDWTKYNNKVPQVEAIKVETLLKEYNRTYTLQEIQAKAYPKGIDTSKLENLLADDEFIDVLGYNREEFGKLPGWQQQKIKREKGLF